MILVDHGASGEVLQALGFACEAELEGVVCRYPQLLQRDGDAPLYFVKNQLRTSAGIADVLMSNSEGLPVVVEVKLARNPGARREIIGQVIDYVATLTAQTVDQINDSVGGALETTLRSNCPNEKKFWQVWSDFGANLRAGLARYILVLDDVPEDLERLVRFLALRSSLDIRLVTVSKYLSANNQVMFVPANIIKDSDVGASLRADTSAGEVREKLLAVIEAYGRLPVAESFPLKGTARIYRQIRPAGWPPALHYEFIDRAASVQVELHLENNAVAPLGESISLFHGQTIGFSGITMRWDQSWSGERGRLICDFPADYSPDQIAQVMVDFMEKTKSQVESFVELNGL